MKPHRPRFAHGPRARKAAAVIPTARLLVAHGVDASLALRIASGQVPASSVTPSLIPSPVPRVPRASHEPSALGYVWRAVVALVGFWLFAVAWFSL